MKTIRSLLAVAAIVTMLSALPQPARADTDEVSFGITNATLSGSATTTTLGVSAVPVKHQDFVGLVFSGTSITTNTAYAVLTLARVDAGGNTETTPRFTWNVPLATSGTQGVYVTNSFVAFTNLAQATISASTSLQLISIQTVNLDGSLASPTLKVQLKNLKVLK